MRGAASGVVVAATSLHLNEDHGDKQVGNDHPVDDDSGDEVDHRFRWRAREHLLVHLVVPGIPGDLFEDQEQGRNHRVERGKVAHMVAIKIRAARVCRRT